jgi:serine/threonine-protein kinase
MNETHGDIWVRQLVDFDENLRLGRQPAPGAEPDSRIDETCQFLLKLQAIWPRAPQKIGGYTLTRSLGQGTLGTTHLVEDTATRQAHVLKIVWPELCADPEALAQLQVESRLLSQLRHAQIAALREIRDAGALWCIVGEYCPGPSVADWRRAHPQPLAWPIVVRIIAGLADTLDVAHRHGVTHGNLKPANLFLPDTAPLQDERIHEFVLKVGDFALGTAAQPIALRSGSGLPWPTPEYLAPEQVRRRARAVEPASDVYALGVLAYELLTGRCPVKGATRDEIIAQIRASAPPLPRQFRPDLPRDLESLVLDCLKKDPRERPASAKILADALRALAKPVEPGPQPAWWQRWLKK